MVCQKLKPYPHLRYPFWKHCGFTCTRSKPYQSSPHGTECQDLPCITLCCWLQSNTSGTVSEQHYAIYGNQRFISRVAWPFLILCIVRFTCFTVYSAFWCCLEKLLYHFCFFLCFFYSQPCATIFILPLFTIKSLVHSEGEQSENLLQITHFKLVQLISHHSDFIAPCHISCISSHSVTFTLESAELTLIYTLYYLITAEERVN
jgi:hypothetical protein